VQHALLRHHLRERVKHGDRALDAGCGPGIFAKELLKLGARVSCFDISKVQLEGCRENAPGCDAYELGSVTDLARFPDKSFDTTLALGGVLSYCFDQAPRAVSELVRVTRSNSWLGLSVMSLYGTMHRFLPGVLVIPPAKNRQILASGDLDRDTNERHECHMFRVAEIRELLVGSGLKDVELYASGWLTTDSVNLPEVDSDEWRFLLEAEVEASRESPGAGTHIIAWCRVS
jgi:SAM-dependent methyltransferase